MKEFGLTESGEDVNVGLYDEQDRKFALIDEEFSEESLTDFVETWKKGKVPGVANKRTTPCTCSLTFIDRLRKRFFLVENDECVF